MTLKKQLVLVVGVFVATCSIVSFVEKDIDEGLEVAVPISLLFACILLLTNFAPRFVRFVFSQVAQRQMLQTRKLYDAGILNETEYATKILELKKKAGI